MARSAALLTLLPGSALAHPGAHLHPHGTELTVSVVIALGAAALAVAALARRR